MNIVIDVVLVAIVIGMVIWSARKGILVTVAEVLAFALAIFLAAQTAKPVAKVTYKALVYKSVVRNLEENLPYSESDVSIQKQQKKLTNKEMAEYVLDNLPDFAKNQIENMDDFSVSKVMAEISQAKIDSNNKLYDELEEKLVRPIAVEVLKHIMYFALAIVYALILRFIFVAIVKAIKQSDTIGTADKVIGGAVGVIVGFTIILLISNLLTFISPRIEKPETRQAIEKSVVVSLCEKFDPMEAVSMVEAFVEE